MPVRRVSFAGDDDNAARPGHQLRFLVELDVVLTLDNVHKLYPGEYLESSLFVVYGHIIEPFERSGNDPGFWPGTVRLSGKSRAQKNLSAPTGNRTNKVGIPNTKFIWI